MTVYSVNGSICGLPSCTYHPTAGASVDGIGPIISADQKHDSYFIDVQMLGVFVPKLHKKECVSVE